MSVKFIASPFKRGSTSRFHQPKGGLPLDFINQKGVGLQISSTKGLRLQITSTKKDFRIYGQFLWIIHCTSLTVQAVCMGGHLALSVGGLIFQGKSRMNELVTLGCRRLLRELASRHSSAPALLTQFTHYTLYYINWQEKCSIQSDTIIVYKKKGYKAGSLV